MNDETDQPGAPPDEANQAATAVEWPHQTGDEVTDEDLRRHLEENPEAYHPDLVPHIDRVIGNTAIEAPADEAEQDATDLRPDSIIDTSEEAKNPERAGKPEQVVTPEVLDNYIKKAEEVVQTVAHRMNSSRAWNESQFRRALLQQPDIRALGTLMKQAERFDGDFTDQYERLFSVMYVEAMGELHKFPEAQQQAAMDAIIGIGNEEDIKGAIRLSMPNCPGIDEHQVARTLAETKEGLQVMSESLDKFSGLDPAIANKLLEGKKFMALAAWPDAFRGLDRVKLYGKLVEHSAYTALAMNLRNFPDADQQDLADQMIEHMQADDILISLDKFNKLDPTKVMHQILTSESGFNTANHFPQIYQFLDRVDNATFVNDMISHGIYEGVVSHPIQRVVELSRGLTSEIAMKLAEAGASSLVLENPDSFTEFDPTAVLLEGLESASRASIPEIIKAAKNFELGAVDRDILRRHLHENTISPEGAYGVYKASKGEAWPELERTVKIFGANAPRASFYLVSAMMDGIEPDLGPLGVTETGEPGLEQLEQAIKDLRSKILSSDSEEWQGAELARLVGAGTTQTHTVVREVLKGIVRFEDSEWGKSTDDEFTELVMARILHEQGSIKPLDEAFTPSAVVEISRVDGKEKGERESPWHEHELKRYQALYESLMDANLSFNAYRPLNVSVQELSDAVEAKREILMLAMDKLQGNPGKGGVVEKLQAQMSKLDAMDLRSIKDFEANFVELAKDKKLHPLLMKTMFTWALHKGPAGYDRDEHTERRRGIIKLNDATFGAGKAITIDDVSSVVNLVDHVINQEVFGKYFKTEEARKAFADMTSVKALQEGIARVQGERQKSDRKVPIQFVPTRGLLMEFSGHIADACWAEQYDSMAAQFPNFTAVNMHRRPGTPQESLVGSFMLIESESTKDGSPLLIIRGLNPLETFINQTDIDEFYGAVTGYVKDLAEKTGRKPAIVIDNHSGGSGTNRPALFGYLSAVKREIHNAPAMPRAEDTTFNGYDITKDTYLL